MFRSYKLTSISPAIGESIEFDWDPETGELRGPGADRVRDLARAAKRRGWADAAPLPWSYPVSDPLRRPVELAVVLGNWYRLPPDLRAVYPEPPPMDDTPAPPGVPTIKPIH